MSSYSGVDDEPAGRRLSCPCFGAPSARRPPPRLLGLALVALSALCFSIMSMLIKIAARTGLGPIAIAGYRGFGAFCFNAAYGESDLC